MQGSLNDMLPEPVSEESEKAIMELLRRKMQGAARVGVRLLRAMEERFGPDAREVVRDMVRGLKVTEPSGTGNPQADLRDFCDALDKGCVGSHRWERVADEPDRIGYHYKRCLWAEVYCELGEPDLGFILCAGDEPAIKSCNPKLGFRRTKTLMMGDELCDHVFLVETDEGRGKGKRG